MRGLGNATERLLPSSAVMDRGSERAAEGRHAQAESIKFWFSGESVAKERYCSRDGSRKIGGNEDQQRVISLFVALPPLKPKSFIVDLVDRHPPFN